MLYILDRESLPTHIVEELICKKRQSNSHAYACWRFRSVNLYHFAWILFILTDFVGEFFTVLHVEVELGEDITTAQRRL